MVHIAATDLVPIVERIFIAAGAPPESAALVASSLVENNLVGHDSHGVLRITSYVQAMEEGRLDPHGAFRIVREGNTTVLAQGGRNFGQVVLARAMSLAVIKAKEYGTGMVAVRECGHTGRMATYAIQAAKEGCIGIVLGTGSRKGGTVAAYGGMTPALNTNPMAWAIPSARWPAVFLDYATSVVAWGKIQAAIDKGTSLSPGWVLDADGQPSTDPRAIERGGVLLPFGRHKGYALSFMVEAIAGGLTGMACALLPEYESDFSTVLVAVDVEAFRPLDDFRDMVDRLVDAVKAGQPAPGVDEIFVPGEIEWRTRAQRMADGLDLPTATWERIVEAGRHNGVEVSEASDLLG